MFDYDTETREIWLYDEFGPGWTGSIDAGMVLDALTAMDGSDVTVRINSPGGVVDEGVAIFNVLREYPGGITTVVDSLAASMASYIMQVGGKRLVADNAAVMVHSPWTIALGNEDALRREADLLAKYAQRMVPTYASRSGKTPDEINQLMRAESWYVGEEIVDAGFADELVTVTTVQPQVAGLHRVASRVPESLRGGRHELSVAARFPRRQLAVAALDFVDANYLTLF